MNATNTKFRSRSGPAQGAARHRSCGGGRGGDPRGRSRLHRFIPGDRARVRQRQHGRDQHDRGV